MARRYGRNQKRKHREKIARLETKTHYLQGRSDRLEREKGAVAKKLADIVKAIERASPHNALLPVKRTYLGVDSLQFWEHHTFSHRDHLSLALCSSLTEPEAIMAIETMMVPTYQLEVWIEDVFDQGMLRKCLHVMARDSKGRWRYCVSVVTMDRFGDFGLVLDHFQSAVTKAFIENAQERDLRPPTKEKSG